ncbi:MULTISPECIES: oxidoreductase [Rhizobium]|uniref:NAD(P)-dependent dehydrogenase (Short-subunit alcohol dehydrogenase family) n=1 Tax=Rhizobium tropici TaxID=398 RepID=A0A6P1CAJ1_RHITR|nr:MULTISPECIES: oxidoreductase [Rhizobium]AGB75394.1 short chain dehydrogenase/reductase [Rhizobium tropici CIAT 899]MBB4241771.1 NAD(P)-dependent dehydrogenase (short-subunit alcohol dehydrogenase family) [Rhizobium tropici]MBB5593582.1 NAD(P)-dependent dehydrogenase (short-subunit alcohol dehydrogenase family) [Rhizobium tropici]MBB6492096.1 NAD(P)-dependent dehydrogenase (short-subunit alcohol dehydrogenase family) [Rhizobium tropici]NEV13461.1 SDR family NAD(P)-dependent oxidoreductase [R
MTNKPVWFITGASNGLGFEIAKHVLGLGYRVVLTARNPAQLAGLANQFKGQALALKVDVTDRSTIRSAVAETLSTFGQIDVLVNNAGYGYLAAIEEGDEEGVRSQFNTNLFGLIDVTKEALPAMRARRSGHIVNVSSLGGLMAFAATGYYHATKFAVEAVSEALAQEVAPLGIKVTIVEPGAFRTNWAGSSMAESPIVIDDYAETAGKRRISTKAVSGNQPGDPARAAAAIQMAVESKAPPLRLLLGGSALDLAYKRLETLRKNFDEWSDVTRSADFPEFQR